MRNLSINNHMEKARIRIFNAADDPVINDRLAPFGYDEVKHAANKALYNETVQFVSDQRKEYGEWITACNSFRLALEKARVDLNRIRKRLSFWLKPDDPKAIALQLYNDSVSKYTNFLAVAKNFYATLLADQETLDKLAPFGYTTETVSNLQQDVNALDSLRASREKEDGDSQYATKARNAKLDELDEACEEIKALGQLVFENDEAQYLEKLGILVRS